MMLVRLGDFDEALRLIDGRVHDDHRRGSYLDTILEAVEAGAGDGSLAHRQSIRVRAKVDRERARAAVGKIGPMIFDQKMVALDPETPGEVHFALDFAPLPSSIARPLFEPAVTPTVHRAAMPKRRTIANALRARTMVAALKPDLLVTYNWGAIEFALAARLLPSIPHLHCEDGFGPEEAHANQLAFLRKIWSARRDSNPRPQRLCSRQDAIA